MIKGYFITGTDTDAGKTLVAAAIITRLRQQGFRVAAMKPVACGCRQTPEGLRNDDAELLLRTASVTCAYEQTNPYAFEQAAAPHIAAQRQNTRISLDSIKQCFDALAKNADYVVLEGVGGWKVPLNEMETSEDMAVRLRLPVILVAGIRLGCLNHALLSCDAILRSGLEFAGWVANLVDPQTTCIDENIAALAARIPAPLLGRIPYLAEPRADIAARHVNIKTD